jgi:hypothetical protein
MTSQLNITRILLIAALIYIIWQQACGGKSSACPEVVSVKTDTQMLYRSWTAEWTKPDPDTIIITKVKWNRDTIIERWEYPVYKPVVVDTAAILQDYFAQVIYRDSSAITDSTGATYGTAFVNDTLSQNRIQARQWRFNLAIPIVTVTKTVEAKPRTQLYVGFNAMFGQTAVGGNVNLTLKTKKDQMFTAGAGLFGQQFYGEFGTKFKLSFK